MSPSDAAVVDAQVQVDRRGVDTHGVPRLPCLVERLFAGDNNLTPVLRILESRDSGWCSTVMPALGSWSEPG